MLQQVDHGQPTSDLPSAGEHLSVPVAAPARLRQARISAVPALWRTERRIVGWIRYVSLAAVRYATNHVVAHIPSYTVRHTWYRHVLGWQIGPGASVLMGQRVVSGGLRTCRGTVSIGEDAVVNHGCLLMSYVPIRIGAHSSVSAGVSFITGGHSLENSGFAPYAAPITVEDYVWIGMNATILGGVTIGKGAVVATGALVTKDVPPFTVVAGSPARVVKRRQLENPSYRLNFRPLFE
jgi:acetyltransferase-like isoleucine patch superfamily enzyme